MFLQYVLIGLGIGGIYALAGQGVVLVYRGSGVVNFAVGPMAMVGAFTFYEAQAAGWSPAAAVGAGVVLPSLIGALTYLLVMRRLTDATPVVRVVAILAVSALLLALAAAKYGDFPYLVRPLLPQEPVAWIADVAGSGVEVTADRVWLFVLGAAVSVICWAVYKFTRFGLVTRAVAEKPMAAATLGRSPHIVGSVNWALGGALAGLSGLLLVGITGLAVGQFSLLMVPALAAALLGRFQSFPLTWITGVTMGVVETLLNSNASWLPEFLTEPGWAASVPFLVIIGVLVARGESLPSRSFVMQRQPHAGTGRVRWFVVAPSVLFAVVFGTGLASIGYAGAPLDWVLAATQSLAVATIALSLVVVTGYAGQLSLAQYSLAGVGAFVAARLASGTSIVGIDLGGPVPFPIAVLVAAIVTVVVGLLFALPALRTRGVNLAIATLGMAVVMDNILFSNSDYTGGTTGTQVGAPSLLGIDLDPLFYPRRYWVLVLATFVLVALVVTNLRRSATGRQLLAVRGNERAAASLGISVGGVKVYAFAVASVIAAIGGVMLAFQTATIQFTQYGSMASISLVVNGVIGGIAFVGSSLITGLSDPAGAGSLLLTKWFGTELFTIGWGLDFPITLGVLAALGALAVIIQNPDGVFLPVTHWLRRPLDRVAALVTPRTTRRRSSQVEEIPVQLPTPDRVVPKSLRIDNLRVSFGEVVAVKDVSLVVEPGLVTGLIGPNGAGKTTVMDAATGFSPRESGSITLGGVSVAGWSARRRARAGLGRSFQSLELFETLTIRDHVSIASDRLVWRDRIRDLFWPRRRPLSPAAVAALTELGLAGELDRRPEDLSHGHRRLLAIARAAAMKPSVLLLDEPAAGLDEHESKELGALIQGLARKWGIGILLVEHDLPLVMSICDRITVINFGETIAEGTPEEIRASPEVIAAYLGETHEAETGKPLSSPTPTVESVTREPRIARSATPMLVAKSLTAGYGGVAAVRDISLEVRPGEVVALLGPNGAGKTTTLLALAGALPMMNGEVTWKSGVTTRSVEWRARNGLRLVPEERSVFMDLTTAENLRIADGSGDKVVELFPELAEVLDKKAGLLSGGQQQMLAVGRAIASNPEVLMADELSLGLAPLVVDRLLQAVRAAADAGAGVLLVEQHARAALEVADRAYVMRRGEVVLEGTADEIRERLADIEDAYLSSADAEVDLAGAVQA